MCIASVFPLSKQMELQVGASKCLVSSWFPNPTPNQYPQRKQENTSTKPSFLERRWHVLFGLLDMALWHEVSPACGAVRQRRDGGSSQPEASEIAGKLPIGWA